MKDPSGIQKIIAEKVIEDGRPFEKISVPEITDKVRYSNTNQVYQFLLKTNSIESSF